MSENGGQRHTMNVLLVHEVSLYLNYSAILAPTLGYMQTVLEAVPNHILHLFVSGDSLADVDINGFVMLMEQSNLCLDPSWKRSISNVPLRHMSHANAVLALEAIPCTFHSTLPLASSQLE